MTDLMDIETTEQAVNRLHRELEHVNEQCRVSHRMSVYWKTKFQACEVERSRLERKLSKDAGKSAHTRHEERQVLSDFAPTR